MKKIFVLLFILLSVAAVGQAPAPTTSTIWTKFNYNYLSQEHYVWVKDGFMIPHRDTNWTPIQPALTHWNGKFYYYSTTVPKKWVEVIGNETGWKLNGNSLAVGTVPKLGTISNDDLPFYTNNILRAYIPNYGIVRDDTSSKTTMIIHDTITKRLAYKTIPIGRRFAVSGEDDIGTQDRSFNGAGFDFDFVADSLRLSALYYLSAYTGNFGVSIDQSKVNISYDSNGDYFIGENGKTSISSDTIVLKNTDAANSKVWIKARYIPVSSAGTDSLVVKDANGFLKTAIPVSSIITSNPTWQQVLTAGSTLTGNNTITGGGFNFTWNNSGNYTHNIDSGKNYYLRDVGVNNYIQHRQESQGDGNGDYAEIYLNNQESYWANSIAGVGFFELGPGLTDNGWLWLAQAPSAVNGYTTVRMQPSFFDIRVSSNLSNYQSAMEFRMDSITIKPNAGRLNIDTLRKWTTIADSSRKRMMTWDEVTGNWEAFDGYFPTAGGGGGTPGGSDRYIQINNAGAFGTQDWLINSDGELMNGADAGAYKFQQLVGSSYFAGHVRLAVNSEIQLGASTEKMFGGGAGDFYSYANSTFYWNVGGDWRFRLTSAGASLMRGTSAPTAYLHLGAGTATANTGPLKFTSGTNLSTPESGVIEFDGTNFYSTNSTAARRTIVSAGLGTETESANDLVLPKDGDVFRITAGSEIQGIATSGWPIGSRVYLLFRGSVTVKHNTAGGAGTVPLLLAGAVDFNAEENDVLHLVYDGDNWIEVSRSVN